MFKNEEIFRKSIQTAMNHRARAQEGLKLVREGKFLSEMQTPATGLSETETRERRQGFIDDLEGKKSEELEKILKMIEFQIEKREGTEEVGTSELNWQRVVILQKLGK